MLRPLLVGSALVLASCATLFGCKGSGGDAGSSSASPASSIKVERTCKDAVGRYGEHFGKSLVKDPKSPVPADKHDKAVAAIKEAVIKSCEEDKWDSLPIDCLASLFEKPGFLPPDKMDDAFTVCANGAGKEKSAKMDDRVARAMLDVMKGSAGSASAAASRAAPWVSEAGGFQIDFHGMTPDEKTKDDPDGGKWHDASLPNGAMVQYADYTNAGEASGVVMVFAPTRDKNKIKRDEPITFQGLKGRDIELTLASGKVFWIRLLSDGKRVFKLGAVYDGDNAEAKAFMESFKQSGSAAAAPSASAAGGAAPPLVKPSPGKPLPDKSPGKPSPKPSKNDEL